MKVNNPYLQRVRGSGIHLRDGHRALPVRLTEREWAAASEQAAEAFDELTTLKAQEDVRRKEWTAGHKTRQAEHARLSGLVHTHEEVRDVKVQRYALLDSNELVTLRIDTGEVVEVRALTAHEVAQANQGTMFDELPPEPDPGAAAEAAERSL